jgi:hypothetical protein
MVMDCKPCVIMIRGYRGKVSLGVVWIEIQIHSG